MPCHRIGNLVPFQDVLEGRNANSEFLTRAQQRQDLVLPITVAVDPPLALEDLLERFEFQVTAWRQDIVLLLPALPA